MVRLMFVGVLALGLTSGCSGLHDRLQGRWTIDLDRMIEADESMAEAARANPEMIEQLRQQMAKFALEFGETSVRLQTTPDEETKSGTYEVMSEEGETLTIKAKLAEEPEETLAFTFDDEDHAAVKGGEDDQTLYIERVK